MLRSKRIKRKRTTGANGVPWGLDILSPEFHQRKLGVLGRSFNTVSQLVDRSYPA